MGQKTCTVSFREPDGTIHTVDVTASTVYEAAVRAIRAFRDEEWSMSPVFRAGVLEIFVKQPVVKHVVQVDLLKKFLERTGGSPHDVFQRGELKSILEGKPQ